MPVSAGAGEGGAGEEGAGERGADERGAAVGHQVERGQPANAARTYQESRRGWVGTRYPGSEYSRAPGGSGNNQIPEIQRLKPLRAEERRWPVAWVRLWRRDMRDTAGIISDRTKLVSSRRPTSFGAPKTFDERRQERKIRCAVVLRTLERSGHARLSAHLHILLASYILIIMIRLTYLSRAFCSRTITPHLK